MVSSENLLPRLVLFLTRQRALERAHTKTARRLQQLFGPDLNRVALKPSMYFSTAAARVSAPARALCLKLRYNATNCGWKQYKNGKAPTQNCFLCGLFDHETHLLGACKCDRINRMNIQKHNDGGQMMLKAFRNKSTIGNSAVLANLGNGETAPHERTLPTWLGLCSRMAPDILILKGWTQEQLEAGEYPTSPAHKQKVTLLFMEYKTCSDFQFAETAANIWSKYTNTERCPADDCLYCGDRFHLFRELRRLGWTVQGIDAAGALGTTPDHDRMLPVLLGHRGFILQSTITTVFMNALQLPRTAAHKLACDLNAHQVASASKIFGTAASLKRLSPHHQQTAAVAAANAATTAPRAPAASHPAPSSGVG